MASSCACARRTFPAFLSRSKRGFGRFFFATAKQWSQAEVPPSVLMMESEGANCLYPSRADQRIQQACRLLHSRAHYTRSESPDTVSGLFLSLSFFLSLIPWCVSWQQRFRLTRLAKRRRSPLSPRSTWQSPLRHPYSNTPPRTV